MDQQGLLDPGNSADRPLEAMQPQRVPAEDEDNDVRITATFKLSPDFGVWKLAPDKYGNAISADAKWTKISRRLVSPEVLEQDKRRYEA
jgi:hypothetical protein